MPGMEITRELNKFTAKFCEDINNNSALQMGAHGTDL
jgi:hypothetical protein